MSKFEGELRPTFDGIGHPHDSERWFRIYGSEMFCQLLDLSRDAGHMYVYLTLMCYQKRGPVNFEIFKSAYKNNFRWSDKSATELTVGGYADVTDGQILSSNYDPKNQGTSIKRPPIPNYVRREVLERDDGLCVYCGSPDNLSMDHIIPISQDGADSSKNLVTCCRSCNSKKSDLSHNEWMAEKARAGMA